MKQILSLLFMFLLLLQLFSCSHKDNEKRQYLPIETLRADSITIPPVLLSVTNMFIANDMLVVYQQRNDTLFSFWKLPECKFLFAAGNRGVGPNDFLMLDRVFKETPQGFKTFEISSNKVKEIEISSDGIFHTSHIIPLDVEQRGLNRFLFLADSNYCFVSDKEEYEYSLLNKTGEIKDFSRYPTKLILKNDDELNRFVYNKLTVAHPTGDKFAAFYVYVKLCRIYDSHGNLLSETLLDKEKKASPGERNAIYAFFPCADEKNIYVLANSNNDNTLLEVWDWNGNISAQYQLDRNISNFTYSPTHNVLYAVAPNREDVIYVYNLNEEEH
ncbi:MAG: hypothetical protein IJP36_01915 [Bacteroides sp.]|nr:hypothetical protein [Bacteroides sp.]